MPRQAHGKPLQSNGSARPAKRKPARGRGLDALQLAEQQNPDQIKIPQHRLGELDDDPDDAQSRANADERSSKRRRVDTERDDVQDDGGSDLEGNQWHVGVDEDDEDSDIDSNDAFGESDEERFAGFSFRGSADHDRKVARIPRQSVKSRSARLVDLSERDSVLEEQEHSEFDEDSDDLGDDAVDLATAWDMNEQADQEEDERTRKGKRPKVDDDEHDEEDIEDGTEDTEASEHADEDQRSILSVSEEDEGDHSRLQTFVEGLAPVSESPAQRPRKLDLRSLPDKPTQFGLTSSKILAADLLQYVKDPQQRQALKILQSSERKGPENYTGGIPGRLAPPLAKRQQDRLDRAAAYDRSKEELKKWIETVKRNRRAEHISFPLTDPNELSAASAKQLAPVSQSQPITELESTIQEIMRESGLATQDADLAEEKEQAFEELQGRNMSLEEVQARRAELRKTRELMFREEIRARRIKKIKSKAYRRIHRKERNKTDLEQRAELSAQGLINSDEERELNDRRRAEERMGARHRESKWAKGVKATGRAAWDDDARKGVTDLARRDEELRRRIEGKAVQGSDVSEQGESSESDDNSESIEGYQDLEGQLDKVDSTKNNLSHSRLGSMAFMQRAEAAKRAANDEEARMIRQSFRSGAAANLGDSEDDTATEAGRQKFGAGPVTTVQAARPQVGKSEFEERLSEDEAEVEELGLAGAVGMATHGNAAADARDSQSKRLQGRAQHTESTKVTAQELRPDSLRSRGGKDATQYVSKSADQSRALDDYTSSSGSNVEDTANGEDKQAQSDLFNSIFAGPDDVVEDFKKEKEEVVKEEGDQVIDNTLPGWGSWAGEGVSKREQKRGKGRFVTTIKGIAADKRQDAKLDRVIVNEKRVKKNGKYLATELPHPFESRQQYERSLRLPLGPEWTTKSTFQDATKPRVLVKQGVIRPMAKPLS